MSEINEKEYKEIMTIEWAVRHIRALEAKILTLEQENKDLKARLDESGGTDNEVKLEQRIEQLEARIKVLEEAFLVLQQRVKDYESQ